MRLVLEGPPDSYEGFNLIRNQLIVPKFSITNPDGKTGISFTDSAFSDASADMLLSVHFPAGQGWQTLEFTLTW